MESNRCKNVWGKKNCFWQEGTQSSWRDNKLSGGSKASVGLSNGVLGSSLPSSRPSSLPVYQLKKEKSKLY